MKPVRFILCLSGSDWHHILSFFLFLNFVLSNVHSSCPSQSARRCFHKFFTNYRFSISQWPSCQTIDYFERCFSFAQCDLSELAYFASAEYNKLRNVYLPKEVFLAIRENLRQRCVLRCHRNMEYECKVQLAVNEFHRERDQALISEIKALRKQLDLNIGSPGSICQQIQSVFRRIYFHRRNLCQDSSVFCLCRRFTDETPKQCTIGCDQFQQKRINSGSVFNRASIPVVLGLIGFSCRFFLTITFSTGLYRL